jgi:hypothetical protein
MSSSMVNFIASIVRRSGATSDVPPDLLETGTFGSRVIYERYGRASR